MIKTRRDVGQAAINPPVIAVPRPPPGGRTPEELLDLTLAAVCLLVDDPFVRVHRQIDILFEARMGPILRQIDRDVAACLAKYPPRERQR